MPVRIRVSNRTAHFLNLFLSIGLGIADLYIAFSIEATTKQESFFLILASVVLFYFVREIYLFQVDLSNWSLASIIYAVPALYSLWMVIKYLL